MYKVAFINPTHTDWSLANNISYLMFQSHYARHGRNQDKIEWLPAPYKYDQYQTLEDIYNEVAGADVYLFSSYVWNYSICDDLAKLVKSKSNAICILGGPHIGTNEPEFLAERTMYDYICQPTKPGEVFVQEFLDQFIENDMIDLNSISWAIGSKKTCPQFMPDYSVYKEHIEYLTEMSEYSDSQGLEKFMALETTRGCPYKCVYCEWGGGTGTKIHKKPLGIVKDDIDCLRSMGYRDVYLTDANFGAFEERDLEIFEYAWKNKIILTDISTMKAKDLGRRTRFFDACFDIIAKHNFLDMNQNHPSIVPTMSIQSISENAMDVSLRTDLSMEDKIKLSEHIDVRCKQQGYPTPTLELILAMPGSTLDEFYDEYLLIDNFGVYGCLRHDYMYLPDTQLTNKFYLEQHGIELVEVYTDLVDEEGVDNNNTFYKNHKNYFKTTSSCNSFTRHEMAQMWFMNLATRSILQDLYPPYKHDYRPGEFAQLVFSIIRNYDGFKLIFNEIMDILNPDTPPRSIKRLQGMPRNETIDRFMLINSKAIISDIFMVRENNAKDTLSVGAL